jgi:hypothetical protein
VNDDNLLLASIKAGNKPDSDPVRVSFKGSDGVYYSFVDYMKEFEKWMESVFLKSLDVVSLKANSFPLISVWRDARGWSLDESGKLIDRNFGLILSKLANAKDGQFETAIYSGDLNFMIHEAPEFEPYYDNCGDHLSWKFPVLTYSINLKTDKFSPQHQFHFLRTQNGYKLFDINFKDDELK